MNTALQMVAALAVVVFASALALGLVAALLLLPPWLADWLALPVVLGATALFALVLVIAGALIFERSSYYQL